MGFLRRPVTAGQLILATGAALVLGIGGSAVAGLSKDGPPERANLGTAGGMLYKTDFQVIGAGQQGGGTAECPNDRHVTGGGLQASGFNGDATHVNSSFPDDDDDGNDTPDDGWTGVVDNGDNDSQTVTVYAICK